MCAGRIARFCAAVALVSFCISAFAAEGVIEINHAKISAAGGYPLTITQAGSYRLTSNLIQPNASTNVINISADNVSIDLNGFSITGSNNCTDPITRAYATCTASGSGYAIDNANIFRKHISISNGIIVGMAYGGINLTNTSGGGNVVENVQISDCGGTGVALDSGLISKVNVSNCTGYGMYTSGGLVTNSNARYNNAGGITSSGGMVTSSIAKGNIGGGINADQVRDSFAISNGGVGIFALSMATGNVATYNTGVGLYGLGAGGGAGALALASQNVLKCNSSNSCVGAVATQMTGVLSIPANSNLCNSSPC